MLDELLTIEKRLWENDADFYEATFLPDAVLIFPETGRIDRTTAIAALRDENRKGEYWAEVRFMDVGVLPIAPDVALLSYTADARWNHETTPKQPLCATVYVRSDGAWRVSWHQQTYRAMTDQQ